MSIEQMRKAIEKVYSELKWKRKVAVMSDKQIIAVYNRMLRDKELVS
jgi:hypothetical protein